MAGTPESNPRDTIVRGISDAGRNETGCPFVYANRIPGGSHGFATEWQLPQHGGRRNRPQVIPPSQGRSSARPEEFLG